VFETRLAECQQLSFEDFKTECLCDVSFWNMEGFAQTAALFIFVEPTQLEASQHWFVACTALWKASRTVSDAEAVFILRYVWRDDIFNVDIRANITLHFISTMNPELQSSLCKALFGENPNDPWINANLPKPPDVESELPHGDTESPELLDVVDGSSVKDAEPSAPEEKIVITRPAVAQLEAVSLEKWYAAGHHSECRFCRYRPRV
jgi:hypothetical protein